MDAAYQVRSFTDPYINRQIEDIVALLNQAKAELAALTATAGGAEPSLGNPSEDDQILSSKTDGTRSWVGIPPAVPTGSLVPFAGSTAPEGWLLCYGQAVSRTTYSDLFSVIETTYGVGDGSTTFSLPDLRGRVWAGLDNMGGSAAGVLSDASSLGATQGVEDHTLIEAEIPAHDHGSAESVITTGTESYDYVTQEGSSYKVTLGSHTHGSVGGSQAHNNVQPTMAGNFIIKA